MKQPKKQIARFTWTKGEVEIRHPNDINTEWTPPKKVMSKGPTGVRNG
jgi:hypothetical protein